MAKIKFQAREIFRAAKRNGITLKQSSFHECAIGVVCEVENLPCGEKRSNLAKAMKTKHANLVALEMGFEGWTPHNHYVYEGFAGVSENLLKKAMKNRYYKVGRNLAKMAGLP